MKKYFLSIIMLLTILCLSACGSSIHGKPADAPPISTETMATLDAAVVPDSTEPALLPLPSENTEFSFLSGAGGWSTILTLNRTGSFRGYFHDSELGDQAEDYPNGTIYVCSFRGEFTDFEKINEYTYRMHLPNVITEKPEGEEWIENGIRYVANTPHGMEDGTEFILYLPNTPIREVPEEFLIWWPYRYSQNDDPKEVLSCYGILNVATNYGFFTAE